MVNAFITGRWEKNLYPMDYFLFLLRNGFRLSNCVKHDHNIYYTVIRNSSHYYRKW